LRCADGVDIAACVVELTHERFTVNSKGGY
jgi:hypothetical protein